MNFNTKLLHGRAVKTYTDGATLPPVSQVNAFRFESARQQEAVFRHRAMGFAYTRVGNPTVVAFEQRSGSHRLFLGDGCSDSGSSWPAAGGG